MRTHFSSVSSRFWLDSSQSKGICSRSMKPSSTSFCRNRFHRLCMRTPCVPSASDTKTLHFLQITQSICIASTTTTTRWGSNKYSSGFDSLEVHEWSLRFLRIKCIATLNSFDGFVKHHKDIHHETEENQEDDRFRLFLRWKLANLRRRYWVLHTNIFEIRGRNLFISFPYQ